MPIMPTRRVLTTVLVAIVLSAGAGSLFGPRLLATEDVVEEKYRVFTAALAAVESQYMGKIESDRLVYSAINGMLQTLDPHSSFLDPKSYAQMRERQEGRYYGLGISIQSIDGDILVGNVFEGSPAFRRGIRRGDIIARIEGESAKGWPSDKAVVATEGTQGHVRQGVAQASWVRRVDRSDGRARRGQHPDAAGRVHGGRAYRLRPASRFLGSHGSRPGSRVEGSADQRHAAAAARPARQPGRAA